ncbi:hypothetical protein HMPREF0629_00336 [Peptoniphilus sp. oral taxon 386 str. F0131]|nr:hypothetical protein HMPREF0629_00336 [Peptoniphilus sp. oral taxon 386 str. F0131]
MNKGDYMNENFQTLPTIVRLNLNQTLQIIRAELTSDLNIAVDVLNLSDIEVLKISFTVIYKNLDDNYLFNSTEFYYQIDSVDIQPQKIYFVKPFKIDDRFKDARAIEIRIKSYTTADGKEIVLDETKEQPYTLALITDEKQKKIKKLLGPEIINYGENLINGWRCVCGAFNSKETQECRHCNRNKNFILNNLTEPLINMKIMSLISNSSESDDSEVIEMTTNLTQTHLSKIAPTTDILEQIRVNEDSNKKPANSFMIFLKSISYILLIVLVLMMGMFAFSFTRKFKADHVLDNAKALLASGKYQQALDELNTLKESDKVEVELLIEKAKKLIESQLAFDAGNNFILDGSYLVAVTKFKEVIPEDTLNFSKSQDKINELENIILEKAVKALDNGNFEQAIDIVNEYLKIVPESANAQKIKDTIKKSQTKDEPTVSESLEESPEFDKNRAEMAKKAEGLLNTYQKVTEENANLRNNPSLDADVITVLPLDSDLYIKDTKIEGLERIWCNVEAKNAITGETFNGWISNKLMEIKK